MPPDRGNRPFPPWLRRVVGIVAALAAVRITGEWALVTHQMTALDGPHGHAYLGYPALALGMARLLDPAFPASLARTHDALVAALAPRKETT